MLRHFSLSIASLAFAIAVPASAQADVSLPNPPEFPDENPMLTDQDLLGKFLFWEEQIGGDNTIACGTCHIHESGGSDPRAFDADSINPGLDGLFGTDDDVRGSKGVVSFDQVARAFVHEPKFFPDVQVTGRKSPSAINAAHFTSVGVFWDGRALGEFTDPITQTVAIQFAGALESQAAGPPVSSVETSGANQSWPNIVAEIPTLTPMALATNLPPDMADFLSNFPTYPAMFAHVYGDSAVTSERVVFAIANYERTLISDGSPLDLSLDGTEPLSAELDAGFQLFNGTANCTSCHTIPFTSDLSFHNIGLRPDDEDIGLEAVTGSPFDRAKFKTPNVRNAALRLPLFHNGQADTVTDLVEFYNNGGDFDTGGLLDGLMLVLNLSQQEKDDLILFIEQGVTDPDVANNVHPFTRPTLGSEGPAYNTIYGVPTLSGAGVEAKVLAPVPGNIGNQDFMVGVYDAKPNALATFVLALQPDPAGTIFEDPAYPVHVNVIVSSIVLFHNTATDANGVATYSLPLPKDALLQGLDLYGMWVIKDNSAPTGRLYTTKGVELPLF